MNSLQQNMPQIQRFSRTKSTQPVCWNWLAGYWQIVVKSTRTSFSCWQRDKLLGVQPWEPLHTLTPPSRHHTKDGIWICVTAACTLQNAAICFQAKLQNRCSHLCGDRSCFRCGRSNIEPENWCDLQGHNSLLHMHSCWVWLALPQTWFDLFTSAVSNLLILQDTCSLKH